MVGPDVAAPPERPIVHFVIGDDIFSYQVRRQQGVTYIGVVMGLPTIPLGTVALVPSTLTQFIVTFDSQGQRITIDTRHDRVEARFRRACESELELPRPQPDQLVPLPAPQPNPQPAPPCPNRQEEMRRILDSMRNRPQAPRLIRTHAQTVYGAWTVPRGTTPQVRRESFLRHLSREMRGRRMNDRDRITYEVLHKYQLQYNCVFDCRVITRVYNDMMTVPSMRNRFDNMFKVRSGYLGPTIE